MKRILLSALLASATGFAMADELLQVIPQLVVAGNEGEEFFTIDMRNDDNVYLALQFDLYLPEGVDLVDEEDVPIYLSEDRFTYKRGVCTTHEASVTKREGFYRIQIYGKNGNVAIPEHEGGLCDVYYTSSAELDGILPVRIENVVLGISGTEGVKPAPNVSFLYTEAVDWADMTSIDLAHGSSVATGDVVDEARTLMTNPNALLYVGEGSSVDGLDNVVAGEQCESLTLTDGHPFNAPKPFTAASATYSRTVAADGWYSLCLPFAAEAPEGVDVERLQSVNEGSIDFVAGGVEADKPCIFNAKAGEVTFEGSNVAVAATPEQLADGPFVGTYRQMEAGNIEGCYALRADGTGFGRADNTAYVTPFRAVVQSTGNASVLLIRHQGDAVGIQPAAKTCGDGSVYSISGVETSGDKLPKGVYVKDGMKFIVK